MNPTSIVMMTIKIISNIHIIINSRSPFVHSFVCPITQSCLNGFHKCISTPNVVLVKKHLNVFVKGYYTAG